MNKPASSLRNILSRSMPGLNLVQISLVEDANPEQYRSKYFAFLKMIPGEKSDQSPTGRTYNHQNSINFKVECEKIFALSAALKFFAEGKGEQYDNIYGTFEIFADSSRSNYGGGDGGKKSVKLGQIVNNQSQKKVICLNFMEEQKKGTGFFTPYDAMSFSQVLDYIGKYILQAEAARQHEVIIPKNEPLSSPMQSPPKQQIDYPKNEKAAIQDFEQTFGTMDTLPF